MPTSSLNDYLYWFQWLKQYKELKEVEKAEQRFESNVMI